MKEYFLNEDEIYYRTNEFKPDRTTLVFAHGVSGSSSAWWPYEKTFESKYNIINYDIRGHGVSKKYPHYADYEIKNFVDDLHKLVTHLNISKFVLISNSFAGLVHIEYLKSYKDTVTANIFTSPEVYLNTTFISKIFKIILVILTNILKILPFNSKPRGHVDYKKYIGSTDWSIGRNMADMLNTGFHAHFFTLRQSFVFDHEYALEKINVPTLVIHGEKDTMVPIKNVVMLSKNIKNAEFISIKNVDHNTVHNAVKEMSESIETFLEKNKNNLIY
jgi:pimeloyl-ACP methyl ester carboxylesterase